MVPDRGRRGYRGHVPEPKHEGWKPLNEGGVMKKQRRTHGLRNSFLAAVGWFGFCLEQKEFALSWSSQTRLMSIHVMHSTLTLCTYMFVPAQFILTKLQLRSSLS